MNAESKVWYSELLTKIESDINSLYVIWQDIGLSDVFIQQREFEIKRHFTELTEFMVAEENERKNRLVENIANLKTEISETEEELGYEKFKLDQSLTLLKYEEALIERGKKLEIEAQSQKNQFLKLRKTEEELCNILKEPIVLYEFKRVPSKTIIKTLEESVNSLTKERSIRLCKFKRIQSSVQDYINFLQLDSDEEIDSRILSLEENKDLSLEFLRMCQDRDKMLETLYNAMCIECEELLRKLQVLTNRLKCDPITFSEDHTWTKEDELKMRKKVDELDRLKKEKIDYYVQQCRKELLAILEKCKIDSSSLDESILKSESSDEVLDKLDEQIKEFNLFYEENRDYFEAIDQYIQSKEKLADNLVKMKDPVILKNRGGILLKIEKEIKCLRNKEIPRLESILTGLQSEVDLNKGTWALVQIEGVSIDDFIEEIKTTDNKENNNKPSKRIAKNDFSRSMMTLPSPKNPRLNASTYSLFSPSHGMNSSSISKKTTSPIRQPFLP